MIGQLFEVELAPHLGATKLMGQDGLPAKCREVLMKFCVYNFKCKRENCSNAYATTLGSFKVLCLKTGVMCAMQCSTKRLF